jgi:hypothetical protein
MFFNDLGIHQDIININDHELIQFFLENKAHVWVVTIDGALHNLNGITINSFETYLVFIAIFSMSSIDM